MGDGVFGGGITNISVRNAMAAHLISSTLSLESLSIAIALVGAGEEWKTNVQDLFASLSMRISSKRSFTFDMNFVQNTYSCYPVFLQQQETILCTS